MENMLKKAKPKIISPSIKYDRDCDSKKKWRERHYGCNHNNCLVLTMVALTKSGFWSSNQPSPSFPFADCSFLGLQIRHLGLHTHRCSFCTHRSKYHILPNPRCCNRKDGDLTFSESNPNRYHHTCMWHEALATGTRHQKIALSTNLLCATFDASMTKVRRRPQFQIIIEGTRNNMFDGNEQLFFLLAKYVLARWHLHQC